MAINWYPGHMHKANKDMREILPQVDLVIELLDCRLPYSSQNPAITELARDKPCIKVLSKSDLADPAITEQWQAHFESTANVKTLLTTLEQSDKAQKLLQLCRKMAPEKPKVGLNIMAMITGIPNVGKSTLINAVAGRKVAKTGDEPAITKGLQRIKIDSGLLFLDTPGILWPKIHNENSGYRLAIAGSIKDTATEVDDLAFYLSNYLIAHYPELLAARYELEKVPATDIEFLELMGEKRGCRRSGGRVDLEKASTILVNEFRAGILGQITLETPEMLVEEEKLVAEQLRIKAEKDALRKAKRRGSRGQPKP
jgi:ribosome biogenesis GTPase A